MTASEIREAALMFAGAKDVPCLQFAIHNRQYDHDMMQTIAQFEIAAQLAELNANLRSVQDGKTLLVTLCQGDEILVREVK